jgi:hypothetical protein
MFSPCIPASSTTNTGRHDIAEILLKVALSTINQIKSSIQITLLHNKIHIVFQSNLLSFIFEIENSLFK